MQCLTNYSIPAGPLGNADDSEAVKDNGFSSKRKLHMDDFSLPKRRKTEQSSLGTLLTASSHHFLIRTK